MNNCVVVPSGDKPLLPIATAVSELNIVYHAASKASACANSGANIFVNWYNSAVDIISLVYGEDSAELKYLAQLDFGSPVNVTPKDRHEFQIGMVRASSTLASWIRTLSNLEEGPNLRKAVLVKGNTNARMLPKDEETEGDVKANSRRVFIVHGHDDALRIKVESVLTKLGFEPIVLRNQPNRFRTIIEKLEDFANVGFAVVLLTPDDIGYDKNKPGCAKGRARQNVVLELGYFWGKLGRNRMMAISDPDVELPGDLSGVVYTDPASDAQWQNELVRELKAAGYEVDSNKLF